MKQILIVEDSLIISLHLQRVLELEGYHVLGKVDSAETALEICATTQVDVILMDVMLSGEMDGVTAASQIKIKFDIPVIFITALKDKETIQRAKIAEPYGFLTKPFEDREIFLTIEMAVYKHQIQEKLKWSELLHRSTLMSISDVVVSIDSDFNITFINQAGIDLLGVPEGNLLNKPLLEVLHVKDQSDSFINPLQVELIQGREENVMAQNLSLVTIMGTKIPIGNGAINSIFSEGKELIGLVITFSDISLASQVAELKRKSELNRISSIIEGQEIERSRIAKDLHDGIGQMLNAIKLNAKSIISDKSQVSDLDSLLSEAIDEIKRISYNLLPPMLRDFQLPVSIKSLCDQLELGSGKQVRFICSHNSVEMKEQVKTNLYRIVQEAVTNSIKHSGATNITVQLNKSKKSLRLTIEDDGNGFERSKLNTRSHGIENMTERTMIMNGHFEIESDKKRGTMIIVEIPTAEFVTA